MHQILDPILSYVAFFLLIINFHRYYSLYGHVDTMAREVHRGAATVEGVEATLWRVSFQLVPVHNSFNEKRTFFQ